MKTAEEVLAYLEADLEKTEKLLEKWRFVEDEEMKYQARIITLERLIDEISAKIEADAKIENKEENAVKCEPTKILTSMPKEKTTFFDIYINVFGVLLFFASFLFMDGLIYDFIDYFNIPKGIFSALIHYGYLLFHIISFALFSLNVHRTFKTKK